MTQYLSAEAILNADDLDIEDVDVPEWGGTVRVRGMSGIERDKFEARFAGDRAKQGENFRAHLAAACMVDDQGKRLFRSEAEVKRLGDRSAQALSRVCDVAMRLSAITDEDQEELEGN